MMIREASRGGVHAQVIDADRHWMTDQESEDALAAGQRTDLRGCLGIDADVDEVDQITVRAQYAEGPVLGIDEIDSRRDDAPEGGAELQTSRDRDDRSEEALILLRLHGTHHRLPIEVF
jgi:hypothetical protein